VTVPNGTNVTALVATFQTTGATVKVGSIIQVSGTTPNDFTSPVQYAVTAADGSTATYTVTVQISSNSNKASWSNGRGNPQNTGYASWAGIATGAVSGKLRSLAVGTVAVNPEWIYTGSGSPNGSFAVIDQEGTIYYQGADTGLYAVKSDGTLKWKATNKNHGFVPPVIGPDGRLYVGDFQDWFYCLDPLDGHEIWSIDFGSYASGFVNAPIITPDGIIYISSWDGNLYALNLDGVLVWKFNQAYSVQGTPGVGQDGTVYTMTDRLYSLNPSSGSVNWSFRPADEPNSTGWWFESSPVIADNGTVYLIGFYNSMDPMLGNIIYLFAVDANGNEAWRYRLTDGSSIMPSGARTYPTLMPDGSILVSVSPTSTLVVLNANGTLKTERVMSQSLADEASPSIDGTGRIYISYRYGFACLSSDLSSVLWEKVIADGSNGLIVESSPSIGSASVYFTVRDGNTGGSLYSFSLNP
jgi:outer membrane protein assembly factor BamB